MNALQPWHIILVVVVFLILFGSKKLPDAARSVGRSMRIFKSEVSEMKNDGAEAEKTSAAATKTDEITSASSTDTPQPTVTVESKDEKKHPA